MDKKRKIDSTSPPGKLVLYLTCSLVILLLTIRGLVKKGEIHCSYLVDRQTIYKHICFVIAQFTIFVLIILILYLSSLNLLYLYSHI